MRVNYRKFVPRMGLFVGVVVVLIVGVVRCSQSVSPVLGGVAYPVQERVHNYVRISVQPVWYADTNTWLFSVHLQSTQNPSFLTIPLDAVAYVQTDQYGSQVPNSWVWTQQDSHETHGNLTWTPSVDVSDADMTDQMASEAIALVVHMDEPITFQWASPAPKRAT